LFTHTQDKETLFRDNSFVVALVSLIISRLAKHYVTL
jgi:hypothetical protein